MSATTTRPGFVETAVDAVTSSRWSLYGLAATRITLGLTIAIQLLINAPDRGYTWGAGARWAQPLRDTGGWSDWPMWVADAGPVLFNLVYFAAIVVALMMAAGLFTRWTTIATLALWMSLFVAAPLIETGGDAILRMTLAYLCLSDCGARFSLDARRAAEGRPRPVRDRIPDWWISLWNNAAVVLIAHQIVMVYVGSSLWKLQSEQWTDGTAVYFPLHTEQFSPWLDQLGWLYGWAPFVLGATYSSLVVQFVFPLLLLNRSTRLIAYVVLTAMHVGIGFFMGIMYFSLVMIAADAVLVSDESWRRASRTLRGWRFSRRRRPPETV